MNNALKIIDVYDLDDQDGQFQRLIRAREKCKKSFLEECPGGFFDPLYVAKYRSTLAAAHRRWVGELNKQKFSSLLQEARYQEIVATALAIEGETDLLSTAERTALKKALATSGGAAMFALALYEYLYMTGENGSGPSDKDRFEHFCRMLGSLPTAGKISRQVQNAILLSWPIATAFGAIAQPRRLVFVKPILARQAALKYGFPFAYEAEPSWTAYSSMLDFAACLRADLSDLRPRDLLDIQRFIKILGTN